jgi:hypothetical protein
VCKCAVSRASRKHHGVGSGSFGSRWVIRLLAAGREEDWMFDYRDLFQWERFITPTIIKLFYWLAIALSVFTGLSLMRSGLGLLFISPLGGLVMILLALLSTFAGIIFSRIIAELILIVFRINEHLGAIRNRGGEV